MKNNNPTALIDDLELATNAATALIDIVCQLHASKNELPPSFGSLGALVAGSLEEASAAVTPALKLKLRPVQSNAVVASN